MSKSPLIVDMRETKFNNNAHFKTLSEEDLFAEEVEPLNNILSKFKYWPRNGNKLYSKRSMFLCGFLLFNIGFLSSFLIFEKLNLPFKLPILKTENKESVISIADILDTFEKSQSTQEPRFNNKVSFSNYEEAYLLRKHFEDYGFDEISPIIPSEIMLTFKNRNIPDALEIVVDKGEIRYRNDRNATYSYLIPDDTREVNNVTNTVSGLPVYGNFGSEDDFNYLMERGISLRGCIILLRLGQIPIPEKVSGAFKRGATGVLLFVDSQQYPYVDLLSVTEEISPTLLADLQKIYNSLETQCSNCSDVGIPVQIIETMTAQNILREMAANKPPDSWRGSLDALYHIGPGFVYGTGRLVLYTYFVNVKYTTYDVAAYLKGVQDNDRYVILANNRKTLIDTENKVESSNVLMEVSKTLGQLKKTKVWKPARTVVFCSFGLKEAEEYNLDSWVQTYKHIIKQRTVAYLDVKQPIQGLEFLNVKASPLLQNLFMKMSSMVENPNTKEKIYEKKTLFDVWYHQQRNVSGAEYGNEPVPLGNHNPNVTQVPMKENYHMDVGDELFASLGIPTLTFGYENQKGRRSASDSKESVVNIYEYENAIIQLWSLLAFSLANDPILPFNVSIYTSILDDFYNRTLNQNQIMMQNASVAKEFERFGEAIRNLTIVVQEFQNRLESYKSQKFTENRIINDKLMQVDKLLMCSDTNIKKNFLLPQNNQGYVFNDLQDLINSNGKPAEDGAIRESLITAENCIKEASFFMKDLYG